MRNSYLAHHGVKGQKWGQRRYQLTSGERTAAGEKKHRESTRRSRRFDKTVKGLKTGALGVAKVAGAALVAYGGVKVAKIALKQTNVRKIVRVLRHDFKEDLTRVWDTAKQIPVKKAARKFASGVVSVSKSAAKVGSAVGKAGYSVAKPLIKSGSKAVIDIATDKKKRNVAVGAGVTAAALYGANKVKKAEQKVSKYAAGKVPRQTRSQQIAASMATTYLNPETWRKQTPVKQPSVKDRVKRGVSRMAVNGASNYAKEKIKNKFFKKDSK